MSITRLSLEQIKGINHLETLKEVIEDLYNKIETLKQKVESLEKNKGNDTEWKGTEW